jgi:alcohol dehydrogenase (cytochrome c)
MHFKCHMTSYGWRIAGHCVAAALLSVTFRTTSLGAQQSVGTGIFTREQAEEGRQIYASSCAGCRTRSDRVLVPQLAGPGFVATWSPASSVDDLFFIMRSTMPPGASAGSAPAFIRGDPKTLPAGGPTQEELNAAPSSTRDWLYHTHDYSGARYVAVDQINSSNAAHLQAVCAFQIGEISNFETGPIVYEGSIFVTTSHLTVALDATNCRSKWRYAWEPKGPEVMLTDRGPNRGVAIKDGRLVRGTSDGYLLELNAQTGELIWARKVDDLAAPQTFTMAPLIFEDLILIGPAQSDRGISGWVGAFRLSDGSEVWRFQTVPGATEKGSKSWPNPAGIKLGGGAIWTPLSLDPEKDELYVPVTNPAPTFPANLRPGDNLYTNSMVVLDIRTGKLRWYKQMVPNDSHDWDLTQVSPLFKTVIGGHERSLVATVGKDGVLRTVDRISRETLYTIAITTINNAEAPVTQKSAFACPGFLGGVEWNGPAYNPKTNLIYVGAVDWCGTYTAAETAHYIPGKLYFEGSFQKADTSQGWITAVDAAKGQARWKYRSAMPIVAAVTTTSGNLVMSGELNGDFLVLDASSGAVLYRFNTGGPMSGGVVTYQQEGKQYIAVASGGASPNWISQNPGSPTIFLFALP